MNFAPDAARGLRLVFVKDLDLQARLGVHPHEKAAPQRVLIGMELAVHDESAPSRTGADDLARVVDYARVVGLAREVAAAGHTLLVETLGERIAAAILEDPRVRRVRVKVEKPDAFAEAASVGVVVERCQG
jgi:7,8-dihydroneopterin aldolase/epimerase/oxygenase